jgi:hypothetical protein
MSASSRASWSSRRSLFGAAAIAVVPSIVAVWLAASGVFETEVNKVLYTGAGALIFGGLLGGVLKILLDNVVVARGKRADAATFVGNVLQDLKSVYDRTARTQTLVTAHQSAKTYGDEMRALIDARVQLVNVRRALERRPDGLREDARATVLAEVEKMEGYLGRLTSEFQVKYRGASERQRTYEALLTEATKRYVDATLSRGNVARAVPPEEAVPNAPWEYLSELPELKAFVSAASVPAGSSYQREFLQPLDAASDALRRELAWILQAVPSEPDRRDAAPPAIASRPAQVAIHGPA